MTESDSSLAEAARWFAARRRGLMTAQELQDFRAWHADPANSRAFSSVERAWTLSGAPAAQSVHAAQPGQTSRTMAPEQRLLRRSAARVAMLGLIVAVGALAAIWWVMKPTDVPYETFTTAVGEQRTVTLADGSIVRLDAATTLRIRLLAQLRSVVVDRGTALFEVAPDVHRPFTVDAGERRVRAVGTRFEVRRTASGARVAVAEGIVAVSAQTRGPEWPGEVLRLKEGESLSFAGNTVSAIAHVPPSAIGEWRTGVLELASATFEDLATELSRYYPIQVQVPDTQLAKRSVAVRLQMHDRDSTFREIEALLDVRLRETTPGTYAIESVSQ